jgi:hypothetical protein
MSEAKPTSPIRRKRDWDAYAAVIASFIGLLALCVSGYTAYVQRQQVHAQVWPRVELSSSNFQGVGLTIANQGMGPADIRAMKVMINGKPIKRWHQVVEAYGDGKGEGFLFRSINGSVMAPGTTRVLFEPVDSEESEDMFMRFLRQKDHAFSLEVCYCSVLEDCWVVYDDLLNQARPQQQVDTCPIKASEQFLN